MEGTELVERVTQNVVPLVAHALMRAASTLVSMPGQYSHHPGDGVETSLDTVRTSACAT